MPAVLAFLEVHGPECQHFEVEITKETMTIGRFREFNDVALEPDPQQLVTRKAHCSIQRAAGTWWVVDNGSVNKTFVKSGQQVEVVNGRAPLADGNIIRILGKLNEAGEAEYWELAFRDPHKTHPAEIATRQALLEYDWVEAKLFRVDGALRKEVRGLRPQEHKLIRYMDQRNRANANVPVMCTYEELAGAVWADEAYSHTQDELNRLIWELRQKVELDSKEPRFLQTVRGLGYRLVAGYPGG